MPRLHSSVDYCTCDQIVATIELMSCANDDCSNRICPDCRRTTNDPDVFACSSRCAAIVNRRMKAEALEFREEKDEHGNLRYIGERGGALSDSLRPQA